MKRPILVGSAAAAYVVAAWTVAPGFYDFGAPPQVYDWVCVPPIAGADSHVAAGSGHADVKVVNGVSDSAAVYTLDGTGSSPSTQVVIGFLPGAFDATGKTSVSVDIKPVSPCPIPSGLHFSTNAYLISASATLVKPANLVMVYSYLVPAPGFVYHADDANGPWESIGGNEGQQFTLQAKTSRLGYFAAGYPAGATSSGGASQLLPIAVAVLIVGVLVAGFPLAMVRRRRAADGTDDRDETDD